jgi:subtilisin-like proprotein convertase family protein
MALILNESKIMNPSTLEFSVSATLNPSAAASLPWHFSAATGLDAETLYPDATGRGVVVAVVDDGFDTDHPALSGRFDASLSWDFRDGDSDASNSAGERHGTRVMGVIGADGATGQALGVASGATLVGVRIGYGSAGNPTQYAKAIAYAAAHADVVNNSWGYASPFADDFSKTSFRGAAAALETAVRDGRDGLGAVVVVAGGNAGLRGDDVNAHDFMNDIRVIAVGGTDQSGARASFATPGAPLLVSAPSTAIRTAEAQEGAVVGEINASGVSLAAAAVSGVTALMLEANPALGWRDVQEILALTARPVDPAAPGWRENGATWINGGGLLTSREVGFGVADAAAAVRLAAAWEGGRSSADMAAASVAFVGAGVIEAGAPLTRSILIDADLDIDHVVVELNFSHQRIGDLRIALVSPSGTESVLLDRIGVTSINATGVGSKTLNFGFSSTEFWGEMSHGVWTLRVEDLTSGADGNFNGATLQVFGDAGAPPAFVFTDLFAALGNEDERRVLRLDDMDQTLNGAALSLEMRFDLARGGEIAGQSVSLEGPGRLSEAIAGAGDDELRAGDWRTRLAGGEGDDRLVGGRADDTLEGGAGDDVIDGGDGHDVAVFSGRAEDYRWSVDAGSIVAYDLRGLDGIDRLSSVEIIRFADGEMIVDDIIAAATPFVLRVFAGGTGGPVSSPEFKVLVDGEFVGSAAVAAPQTYAQRRLDGWATETFEFDLSGKQNPSSIVIVFDSDGRDPQSGEDVNLFVDAIEVSGNRFEAEHDGWFYALRNGDSLNGARQTLFWNGELHFDLGNDWG